MTDDLLTKWRARLRDELANCPGCKTPVWHCCWVATGSMRTCAEAYRDTDGMVGNPPCKGCARQADRLHAAEAVVAALEQTLARSDGCEGGQVASALAAWKAELARLQGGTKAARLCKTKSMTASRCSCKKDADNDCVTCGERVWWSERQEEHNCAEGWKS